MGEVEIAALSAVIRRRSLCRGDTCTSPHEVDACEKTLATLLRRRHVLLLNSGTSALLVALQSLGVGRGDEVILPAYGWLTDVTAVIHLGAIPVIAAVDPALGLEATSVAAALSRKTKAIVPVHACGQPCDMAALQKLAVDHGLPLLEDACQAFGARYAGAPVGGQSMASIFSFQSFKLISCGEGGALATDDDAIYREAVRLHDAGLDRFGRSLRWRGRDPNGIGLNLRMGELSAAVLRCQLDRLPALLHRQAVNGARLDTAFQPWTDRGYWRPVPTRPGSHQNHTYRLWSVDEPALGRFLAKAMSSQGVPLRVAADDATHAVPGWLHWLRSDDLPHRVIQFDASLGRLSRTLILDVPSELPDETWARLHELADRTIAP